MFPVDLVGKITQFKILTIFNILQLVENKQNNIFLQDFEK